MGQVPCELGAGTVWGTYSHLFFLGVHPFGGIFRGIHIPEVVPFQK